MYKHSQFITNYEKFQAKNVNFLYIYAEIFIQSAEAPE